MKPIIVTTKNELKAFARSIGKADIHQLILTDVLTSSDDVARYTDITHV